MTVVYWLLDRLERYHQAKQYHRIHYLNQYFVDPGNTEANLVSEKNNYKYRNSSFK